MLELKLEIIYMENQFLIFLKCIIELFFYLDFNICFDENF